MFDFERWPVYRLAEEQYKCILERILCLQFDRNFKDQIRRASSSILLNIAEGAGKYSKLDKKNYYIVARGSVHECVSLLKILKLEGVITDQIYKNLYDTFTIISKMLTGLIKKMVGG